MIPSHLLCIPLIQTIAMPVSLCDGKRALPCLPRVLEHFPGLRLTKVLPPVLKDNFSIIGGELRVLNTTHLVRMYTERADSCTLFCMTKDGVPLINMHLWVQPHTRPTHHELTVSVQFFRSRRLVRDIVDRIIDVVRREFPSWAEPKQEEDKEGARGLELGRAELAKYRAHVLRDAVVRM